MGDGFSTGVAVGVGATLVVLVVALGGFLIVHPWLRMILSGGRASFVYVLGMRLRGTPVALVTDAYISLVQRGESVTLREVESQYIAHRHGIIQLGDLIDRVTEHLRRRDAAQQKSSTTPSNAAQGIKFLDQHTAAKAAPTSKSVEAPYGVDRKPMPSGEDLELLLPPRVGSFQRGEIRVHNNDIHTGPIYAEYTDGAVEIWMELGICGTPANAQQAIETVKAEAADVTTAVDAISVGTEPSFLKIRTNNPRLDGKGVSVSWTRGEYFFTAGTREDEILEKFMRMFPH